MATAKFSTPDGLGSLRVNASDTWEPVHAPQHQQSNNSSACGGGGSVYVKPHSAVRAGNPTFLEVATAVALRCMVRVTAGATVDAVVVPTAASAL